MDAAIAPTTWVDVATLVAAGLAALAALAAAGVSLWSARTERHIDKEWWKSQRISYQRALSAVWALYDAIGSVQPLRSIKRLPDVSYSSLPTEQRARLDGHIDTVERAFVEIEDVFGRSP